MKTTFITILIVAAAFNIGVAQENTNFFLGGEYDELTDTKSRDAAQQWGNKVGKPAFMWGSTDIRYGKHIVPTGTNTKRISTKAWRGERINAQAVLFTSADLGDVTISASPLRYGKYEIPASAIKTNFVRYVMTDELNKDGKGSCGHRPNHAEWDSSIVADVLDINKVLEVIGNSTQPIWLNIWVPQDTKPGKYRGKISVTGDNFKAMSLNYEVEVLNRVLPEPQDWGFYLDLWQNPYSVARYHQLPLWSKEHFDAMRPIMKTLANMGQKAITASIMHKPWNGQTEDHYDSMVLRTKKIDGSWDYDYTVFDMWVGFMLGDVGIDGVINCYTMIPWALSFDYFDQASNTVKFIDAKPGDPEYTDYWLPFLKDFAKHLKARGWFERTAIAMDERGLGAMKEAIKLIREADPNYKISLAGHYHAEIENELYDLSLAFDKTFPEDVLERRRKEGKISTVYTCCAESKPNTYTFSPPAEAAATIWHAVAGDYDGYLRWSFNHWTKDPLLDSRFRSWASGDCYMIYPGLRSSIRLERFIEGLQDAEKISILRKEFEDKGDTESLNKIDQMLTQFSAKAIKAGIPLEEALIKSREILNKW